MSSFMFYSAEVRKHLFLWVGDSCSSLFCFGRVMVMATVTVMIQAVLKCFQLDDSDEEWWSRRRRVGGGDDGFDRGDDPAEFAQENMHIQYLSAIKSEW